MPTFNIRHATSGALLQTVQAGSENDAIAASRYDRPTVVARQMPEFDLAQQAGQVSAASRAAEFGAASEEPVLVRLNFQGNLAYDADSVPGPTLSLGELLGDLQDAIEKYGEDAELATFQTNNGTGANWGRISTNPFTAAAETEGDF